MSGDKIVVKVVSIDKLNVYYSIPPNENTSFITKDKLGYIKYSSGEVYFIKHVPVYKVLDSNNLNQPKGQLAINIGIGYSPEFNGDVGVIGPLFPVPKNFHYYNCSSITPNMGMIIDYGIDNKLGIGLAASYQSEIINPDESAFTDKVTRINLALRILDHLNKTGKHFDHFIGVRFGCSYWEDVPTILKVYQNYTNITPQYFISRPNSLVMSIQLFYGMRIYLSNVFGIHLEAGIGSPYLIEGGLTFRIKTRKEKT